MKIFKIFIDEPKKKISLEEKDKDNKEDELLKLVDDVIENVEIHKDSRHYNSNSNLNNDDFVQGRIQMRIQV